jgi:hypothetical protein
MPITHIYTLCFVIAQMRSLTRDTFLHLLKQEIFMYTVTVKVLGILFLVLGVHIDVQAEDVVCTFQALKIDTYSCDLNAERACAPVPVSRSHPFSDCRIYFFLRKDANGIVTYDHHPKSPGKTDSAGNCDFVFNLGETYYLYFSGVELKPDAIAALATKEALLIRFLAAKTQPTESKFAVSSTSGRLNAELKYSLPLWITRLQKFEAAYGQDGNKTLSAVRQLVYFGKSWAALVPSPVSPLIEFDPSSGNITKGMEFVATTEPIAYFYKKSGVSSDTYELKEGKRQLESRFDFVSLPDSTLVQVFHILAGFDSYLNPTQSTLLKFGLIDSTAAATWSGDLAQAGHRASELGTLGIVSDKHWAVAFEQKAKKAEIISDVIGSGLAEEWTKKLETASLSSVIEDLLCDKKVQSTAAAHFKTRYKIGSFSVPTTFDFEVIAVHERAFMLFWIYQHFTVLVLPGDVYSRPAQYFFGIAAEMEKL